MEIFSGFLIGLLGSFHCAAMCGPIALSFTQGNDSRWSYIKGRLFYNSGRIITYSFLGLVFGFFGDRIFMFGMQRSLTIGIGILILLSVILKISGKNYSGNFNFPLKTYKIFKEIFGKLLTKKSRYVSLALGMMNGLLPCGFVYIALSGAMITADASKGFLYMMLFGLGTVPMMLSISIFGNNLSLSIRNRINKLIPALTIVLGVLFIMRGLNLGIPYVSPSDPDEKKNVSEELICG